MGGKRRGAGRNRDRRVTGSIGIGAAEVTKLFRSFAPAGEGGRRVSAPPPGH
ncbi:MAG TPA: hypothetical protein PK175_03075 [Syntrophales bacterium]|nr:hypothetical protein [Syntrophales bacterium]HOU76532.1 hypothetical protein [Syntrophales bacterium]HPC32445.1 hypothetical protein [Syntrophales bacterium]HQG33838.1 hypothetical protein [Syntrophales bacterium]HQI35136.1 hypothetical protein [Syntrophales bacterium]